VSLLESFRQDLVAFLVSGIYVVFVIALAEVLRRRGMPQPLTRKIVHVGIGVWIVPTYMIFENWYWAAMPAAGFVVFNALAWHFEWFESMKGEKRNIGVILFPLSTALALSLFWEGPARVVGASAMLVLTFGDAAAAIVGGYYGRTHYVLLDHQRSLEGSAAMFVGSVLAILGAFLVFGAPVGGAVVLAAVIAAAVATGVEAMCPWGLDNLLIPASVVATLLVTKSGVWG
jgi:dolichol kinase